MYKIASLGLIAVLAVMIVPVSFETNSNDTSIAFYGYSVLSVKDISGVTVFESGVHNEVLNEGVLFLMNSALDDVSNTAGPADEANSINAICLDTSDRPISNLFSASNETITFTEFNNNDGNTSNVNNCVSIEFTTVSTGDGTNGEATSNIATFVAGGVNLQDGDTIVGIAICNGGGTDSNNCAGALLAMIDTDDVTVSNGETVDITYTMRLD